MEHNPDPATEQILDRAHEYVRSVPYAVTARWVFYRLLQDGWLDKKSDYKRLLSYLSKARKRFYKGWRPWLLADDTRMALLRGTGPVSPSEWVEWYREGLECNLDRWTRQENYVEVWFEASAMQSQFEHYVNESVTLLAFHGDISIPEKWKSAERLYQRWRQLQVPVKVLYYGDLDLKGLQIPLSAKEDVLDFVAALAAKDGENYLYVEFADVFSFERVGINEGQPEMYGIPENPERPGTYQWEALDDASARGLIEEVSLYLDEDNFDEIKDIERDVTETFQSHMENMQTEVESWTK